jgi:hypothetical protein
MATALAAMARTKFLQTISNPKSRRIVAPPERAASGCCASMADATGTSSADPQMSYQDGDAHRKIIGRTRHMKPRARESFRQTYGSLLSDQR